MSNRELLLRREIAEKKKFLWLMKGESLSPQIVSSLKRDIIKQENILKGEKNG